MLQRDKKTSDPKYTQSAETKERIPRINKPNAKPNQTIPECMYPFWWRRWWWWWRLFSFAQLLLLYYSNCLHTFLPLFSFFYVISERFYCHLHRSFFLTCAMCFGFGFLFHLNVLFLYQLWNNENASFVIWLLCICMRCFLFVAWLWYEQPSALIVATHFWYIIQARKTE